MIKMKRLKFRYRVIITIVSVVLFISFLSFHFFHYYFLNKIRNNYFEDLKSMLSILHVNYLYNLESNGGKILYPIIDNLVKDSHVQNAYLLDENGRLVYSPISKSKNRSITLSSKNLIDSDSLSEFKIIALDSKKNIYRGFMPLYNNPSCYSCHPPSKKQLGYIVLDLNLASIQKNSEMFINFGRFFSILLILFILSSMRILHYRTIQMSLNKFKFAIANISKGNFSERVAISDVEELGDLAHHFNLMIEKIQDMQIKLNICNSQKLKNAKKLASIGEMAASLAHEIKNPLMGITNAIEVIAREISDPEHKFVLREIRYQADRVNKAINDLLQYAKPIELKLELENLNEIIMHIVTFYQNQLKGKNVTFKISLDFNLPLFKIDRRLMENVLINLIQNAIQALSPAKHGEILITTKYFSSQDLVEIVVKDNGVGIPEENLNNIFKPFFSTKQAGTGLGLAIIERIIEQHNGNIRVESKVNQFTKFIITLPIQSVETGNIELKNRLLHGSY